MVVGRPEEGTGRHVVIAGVDRAAGVALDGDAAAAVAHGAAGALADVHGVPRAVAHLGLAVVVVAGLHEVVVVLLHVAAAVDRVLVLGMGRSRFEKKPVFGGNRFFEHLKNRVSGHQF